MKIKLQKELEQKALKADLEALKQQATKESYGSDLANREMPIEEKKQSKVSDRPKQPLQETPEAHHE